MCEIFKPTKPGVYNPLNTSLLRGCLNRIVDQKLPDDLESLTKRLDETEAKQAKEVQLAQ